MVKVLHVLCDLAGGGAERLVLDLCRFAHEAEPRVATVHDGGALAPAFAAAGVRVDSAGRRRGGPGLDALARLTRLARQVDVVHAHLWAGETWGLAAARLAGKPALSTEHNTAHDSPLRGRLSRLLQPETVVGVSAAAAALRGLAPGAVIHNGVDLSRFAPRAPPIGPARRLLAIGRLLPQKGFDVAIAAMRWLPELHLDIIGEGEERPRLVGDRVTLRGWLPDVRPALAEADLFVMPSRWEGFGLVAVEAMAAGVPVVASEIPGLADVVGDAAVLVPPEDPVALAAALRELAGDPARRAALAALGLARAREFDIRRTVAAYEALYLRLAARASRG